jgi:hypothetical protein
MNITDYTYYMPSINWSPYPIDYIYTDKLYSNTNNIK